MQVVDGASSHVLALRVDGPADLETLASELDAALAREEVFTLRLSGPADLESLEALLWSAPEVRRRLRRRRAALAAWCDYAEFAGAALTPAELRRAELIWGCRVVAA